MKYKNTNKWHKQYNKQWRKEHPHYNRDYMRMWRHKHEGKPLLKCDENKRGSQFWQIGIKKKTTSQIRKQNEGNAAWQELCRLERDYYKNKLGQQLQMFNTK